MNAEQIAALAAVIYASRGRTAESQPTPAEACKAAVAIILEAQAAEEAYRLRLQRERLGTAGEPP